MRDFECKRETKSKLVIFRLRLDKLVMNNGLGKWKESEDFPVDAISLATLYVVV